MEGTTAVVNGDSAVSLPDKVTTEATKPTQADPNAAKARPKRPPKPNYAQIHSKPLPLAVHPLPAFIPHSPLSLFRVAYVLLQQFFSPPSSRPSELYIGYFSAETRSIHITDPQHVRALWEMGFFGKGLLSRSEPSWLGRERAKQTVKTGAVGSAEEATRKRREERRLFKLERARLEREQIEAQLRQEKGLGDVAEIEAVETLSTNGAPSELQSGLGHVFPWQASSSSQLVDGDVPVADPEETQAQNDDTPLKTSVRFKETPLDAAEQATTVTQSASIQDDAEPEVDINQEHLQLTLEEAFFLSYGLGVLAIFPSPTSSSTIPATVPAPFTNTQLFTLFRRHSTFPPTAPTTPLRPDDPFLLHYVVYHHFRSLGWVIRPGTKFSVDYLLYNRGPVFSHAEFAVMIVPEYSRGALEQGHGQGGGSKDWWWLHCVNRVQSQVRKSLVLCYVEVPAEVEGPGDRGLEAEVDIGAVLRRYRVREFVIRRWLANRSRD